MAIRCSNQYPIGVFDSGLGGLSVLSEIHHLLPGEKLLYVGDSCNAPYGNRSASFIRERSLSIADFLISQGVKAIVIACNTATAEAISTLREKVDIPVIGLEPAIKPASKVSKSGVIGVLATQRTIHSERLINLIKLHAKDKTVITQSCPGLVEQVEACELTSKTTYSLLNRYIQPLLEKGADTLILGCTHYPFLLPTIRHIVGKDIQIVETSKPVALQLRSTLKKYQIDHFNNSKSNSDPLKIKNKIKLYNTSPSKKISTSMQQLWQISTPEIQHSEISTSIIKPIEVLPLPALN